MKKSFPFFAIVVLLNFIPILNPPAQACDKEDIPITEPFKILTVTEDNTTVCLVYSNNFRILSVDGLVDFDTSFIETNDKIRVTLEKGLYIIAEKDVFRGLPM